jgi:hypothetical protein
MPVSHMALVVSAMLASFQLLACWASGDWFRTITFRPA